MDFGSRCLCVDRKPTDEQLRIWRVVADALVFPSLDSCGICTLNVCREHKSSCPAHRECQECDNQLEQGEIGICAECIVRVIEEMP